MQRKKNAFRRLIAASIVVLFAFSVVGAQAAPKYEASWDSLDKRPMPAWFQDAKFGIFIHWGVYSVPSWAPKDKYAEWYWNAMGGLAAVKSGPTWDFHERTYGAGFQYHDFAHLFKTEMFDPNPWAEVFKKSGAKYVVLTSKHHDGFCLWPSEEANRSWGRPWNSVDIGPKRDLLGDLGNAVTAVGLRMGFYYSLYEWYNPLWLADKRTYIEKHMIPQFKDVVSNYKPSIIFADGEWDLPSSEWKSEELLAWLYNDTPVGEEVVVNDRWGKECRHVHGGYYTTEYTSGLESDHPWEENRGMGHSYGYNRNEALNDYKTGRELTLMLVDLVSRGGNLLLDIGPTGDGRIPVIMEERLIQIGEWLKVNGEAIYGTRPWKQNRQWSEGEIPKTNYGGQFMVKYDINDVIGDAKDGKAVIEAFFTSNGSDLYAITPRWPGDKLILKGVKAAANTTVHLLGAEEALPWKEEGENLVIQVPQQYKGDVSSQNAYAFKITNVQ